MFISLIHSVKQRITRPPASAACPRPDRGVHSFPCGDGGFQVAGLILRVKQR